MYQVKVNFQEEEETTRTLRAYTQTVAINWRNIRRDDRPTTRRGTKINCGRAMFFDGKLTPCHGRVKDPSEIDGSVVLRKRDHHGVLFMRQNVYRYAEEEW